MSLRNEGATDVNGAFRIRVGSNWHGQVNHCVHAWIIKTRVGCYLSSFDLVDAYLRELLCSLP